ncbi:hypothetical protein D3C87_2110330 [compost metagenome]
MRGQQRALRDHQLRSPRHDLPDYGRLKAMLAEDGEHFRRGRSRAGDEQTAACLRIA